MLHSIRNCFIRLPLLCLVLALVIRQAAIWYPRQTEAMYSSKAYLYISWLFTLLTSWFSFSLAEIIIAGLLLFLLYRGTLLLSAIKHSPHERKIPWTHLLVKMVSGLGTLYLFFLLSWGLNYSRLPFADLAGLKVNGANPGELEQLCQDLIMRANALRTSLPEDNQGVMTVHNHRCELLEHVPEAYVHAGQIYPFLSAGTTGRVKILISSPLISYIGISGFYFPFSGEGNINSTLPDAFIPSTACHEIAHQKGFAREDEANYIAYLACVYHSDPYYQYSGTLLALSYSMNALNREDQPAAQRLQLYYGPGVNRDLLAWKSFWDKHRNPLVNWFSSLNHLYLKSNQQQEGIYSYGRMIDLLLADFRSRHY